MGKVWDAVKKALETLKPSFMYMSNSDLFVLVEINLDDVTKTEPMNMDGILKHILNKYADQPIKYFNETQRLKVVHLKSGIIKSINLVLEF